MNRGLAYVSSTSLIQVLIANNAFAHEAIGIQKIFDPTDVNNVNTAGTVRSCNLANVEALFNIIANGSEIIGILVGSCIIIKLIVKPTERKHLKKNAGFAAAWILGGMLFPPGVNWLIATARELNLFS